MHAIAGVGGNLCRLPEAHGGVNQIVQDQAGSSVSLFINGGFKHEVQHEITIDETPLQVS